jgi:hypothetical protein
MLRWIWCSGLSSIARNMSDLSLSRQTFPSVFTVG